MVVSAVIVLCVALQPLLNAIAERLLFSQPDTYLAGPLFAGNTDQTSSAGAAAEGPVLVGLHPHVPQYWASLRLRRAGYAFLVPQDPLGASGEEGRPTTPPSRIFRSKSDRFASPRNRVPCRLFLDWAAPVASPGPRRAAAPVAAATFALYRIADVAFLRVRDGWSGLEALDPVRRGPRRFAGCGARVAILSLPDPARALSAAASLTPSIDATVRIAAVLVYRVAKAGDDVVYPLPAFDTSAAPLS